MPKVLWARRGCWAGVVCSGRRWRRWPATGLTDNTGAHREHETRDRRQRERRATKCRRPAAAAGIAQQALVLGMPAGQRSTQGTPPGQDLPQLRL